MKKEMLSIIVVAAFSCPTVYGQETYETGTNPTMEQGTEPGKPEGLLEKKGHCKPNWIWKNGRCVPKKKF